jgi:perosamine synthetase
VIDSKKEQSFVIGVVEAIREVVGTNPVALHEPNFNGNEWLYVKDCIDSTYVSSIGSYVEKFEEALANYTGAKHAVSLVNGTEALHIALKLAGVERGDEVLIPALTFVATANAVVYCGAIPHFVEIDKETLGIDGEKLREYLDQTCTIKSGVLVNRVSGRTVRALVPMHTFGHPSKLDLLIKIAREYSLVLVEDAAESLGSFYHGKHTGTFGLMGTLSFNGNKIITTGGGGAILTNDTFIAKRAKHLTTTAKVPHKWEFVHDDIGYNYRLPNINCALGLAQLEKIDSKLLFKRELFSRYENAFTHLSGVKVFKEPKGCSSNYWLQTLLLDKEYSELRDQILQFTNESGISTRPAWKVIKELAPFSSYPSMDLTSTKNIAGRIINLPSSPNLIKSSA